MKRLVKSFLSLLAGIALFSGVTACKVDVDSGDPAIEVGIFLTQTPVIPVNGNVTVDVNVIPKKVQMLKWLEGEKTIADFKDSGTELTVTDGTASFTVSKSGNYTVYAKANSRSEAVKTIFVEDVTYDLKDLITLSQSPAVPLNGDVVVEVTLNRQDVQLVKYAKGELEAEAFEKVGTEVVKDDNGKYTFTVSEKDWYTVYAKVNSKSFAVKKIDVEDVAFDVSGLISLSQSPAAEVPTNQEVTITALLSRSDAQTVKWAAGTHTIEDFATIRSTELTAGEDGKYSFTVTENGTYTVYAQCNSKSKAVNVISVTNIDKTAPAAVTNLAANYVHSLRTINISWGNPAETDLDHAIVHVKNGDTVIVDDAEAKGNSYAVSDYTADNTTTVYISVKVADKAGNISGETTYSFVPKAIPEVQSITLDRYHISYKDTNRKITAVANISNMDELSEEESIKIQVINTSGSAVVNKTATVNKTAGTATIEFDAPSGKAEYRVRVKIGSSSADTIHTVRLAVTEPCDITSLVFTDLDWKEREQVKSIKEVANASFKVTIKGTNIDLGPVNLYWKDEGDNQYGEAITVDTSDYTWTDTTGDSDEKTINLTVPCPKDEGVYYLGYMTVRNDYTELYKYPKGDLEVDIYGDVSLSDLYIPKVDISKEDNPVSVTLRGNNFSSPEFDIDDIEFSCSNSSIVDNVILVQEGDDVIIAKLTIPGTAGDYEVKARYKSFSETAVLHAEDYSAITVGSVVLSDNSLIPYSEDMSLTDDQKNSAVGVIGGFDCYGVPFVLGKKKSTCKDTPVMTKTYFAPGTKFNYDEKVKFGITGGFLESNSTWFYISDSDPQYVGEGIFGMTTTKVLEKVACNGLENDYPAFAYCRNYPETQGLTGKLASDWYLPSIYEVFQFTRKNSKVLDPVLKKINGDSIRGSGAMSSSITTSLFHIYEFSEWSSDHVYKVKIEKFAKVVRETNYEFTKISSASGDYEYNYDAIYAIKQY